MPDNTPQNIHVPQRTSLFRSVTPWVLGFAIALVLHFFVVPRLPPFHGKMLVDIGIAIILAVSLNIVNGFTGQFSIGHAGFMAVGGYVGAAVVYYGSYSLFDSTQFNGGILSWGRNLTDFSGPIFAPGDTLFLFACLLAGLAAAIAGLIVGLPSIRLRGDYLAIVTLGFGEIVRILIQQSKEQLLTPQAIAATSFFKRFIHLGGALGISQLPFYTTPFWVWSFVVVTVLFAYRLRQSTYGRAFLAIRENEIAAAAMGVPVTRYKVTAFIFAAFFAGIAGCLFAHQLGNILNPSDMGFQRSFDILIMVVLGGLGSICGSIFAAIVLTILPELLRNPEVWPHVWHVSLIAIAIIIAVRRRRGIRAAVLLTITAAAIEGARAADIHYDIDLSRYRMILYALMLILMMILRPAGLLGVRELWELSFWRRLMPRRRLAPGAAAP